MSVHQKHSSVPRLIMGRQIDCRICNNVRKILHATDSFIKRMGVRDELRSELQHSVDCIEWSESGRFILSATDGNDLILWDPFAKKVLLDYTMAFGFREVISAKFLPKCNDSKLMIANRGRHLLEMDLNTSQCMISCSCAANQHIAVAPNQPDVYWTAVEGIIRQFDRRIPHRCSSSPTNLLVSLCNHVTPTGVADVEITCMTVNPVFSNLLAVGTNDAYIRLYDRRMIRIGTIKNSQKWIRLNPTSNPDGSAVTENDIVQPFINTDNLVAGSVDYFIPGHLNNIEFQRRIERKGASCISFSSDGREFLCSYADGHVYLFDTMNKRKSVLSTISQLELESQSVVNHRTGECSNVLEKIVSMGFSSLFDPYLVADNVVNEDNHQNYASTEIRKAVECLIYSADMSTKRNDLTSAIQYYTSAIELSPKSFLLYQKRAEVYMDRSWGSDTYAAMKDCYKTLELSPNCKKASSMLIDCLFELHLFDETLKYLEWYEHKFLDHHHMGTFYRELIINKKRLGLRIDYKSSSIAEYLFRKQSYDFERRYYGDYFNQFMFTREANFFGIENRYIIAGSDFECIFFWDRKSENKFHMVQNNNNSENKISCLKPHPELCFFASGCRGESAVKIWSPVDNSAS